MTSGEVAQRSEMIRAGMRCARYSVMDVFGVKLVGVNTETAQKVLLTLALFAAVRLISAAGHWLAQAIKGRQNRRAVVFWSQQVFGLLAVGLLALGIISIWFNSAGQLATVGGIASAGIAFALQRPITAVAGYFVVLRPAECSQ